MSSKIFHDPNIYGEFQRPSCFCRRVLQTRERQLTDFAGICRAGRDYLRNSCQRFHEMTRELSDTFAPTLTTIWRPLQLTHNHKEFSKYWQGYINNLCLYFIFAFFPEVIMKHIADFLAAKNGFQNVSSPLSCQDEFTNALS